MIYYKNLNVVYNFRIITKNKPCCFKLQGFWGSKFLYFSRYFFFSFNSLYAIVTLNKFVVKALTANLVALLKGLQVLYKVILLLRGLGFRCNLSRKYLILRLGYTHILLYRIPDCLQVKVRKKFTRITIFSSDLQRITAFCANVRRLKVPEPFKGKGIRYIAEYTILKPIKKL